MEYTSQQNDWLIHPFSQPASVKETDNRLILGNGLIERTFVTSPNFATVDYTNQISGSSLLCNRRRLSKVFAPYRICLNSRDCCEK